MRRPVSTPCKHAQQVGCAVPQAIAGFAIYPCAPYDTQPATGEYAYGVRVIACTCLGFGVDVGDPVRRPVADPIGL